MQFYYPNIFYSKRSLYVMVMTLKKIHKFQIVTKQVTRKFIQ